MSITTDEARMCCTRVRSEPRRLAVRRVLVEAQSPHSHTETLERAARRDGVGSGDDLQSLVEPRDAGVARGVSRAERAEGEGQKQAEQPTPPPDWRPPAVG